MFVKLQCQKINLMLEALKAYEKQILMKVEMAQRENIDLSEDEYERLDEPKLMEIVKRPKLHGLRTLLTRYLGKSFLNF